MTTTLVAPAVRLAEAWVDTSHIVVAGSAISSVSSGQAPLGGATRLSGPVIPAIPNLHSHAFQRAIAGLTEVQSPTGDDFWSWRQAMYNSLAHLTPDDVRVIATQLYVEMVKAGYSRICEFQYLHNDIDGRPYAHAPAMSDALVEAAKAAGIGLTLIPVLYTSSNFGGRPPEAGQRRFIQTLDQYMALVEHLRTRASDGSFEVGIGFHSLRAATPDQMRAVLAIDDRMPVHMHIAEQTKEVDDSLAWSGKRPVDWLAGEFEIDQRWCLVHATHMTDSEAKTAADSGATVSLCPTTEGNLGDGFFNADVYFEAGGRWGVGSDSHVGIDPREELRLLEYGRRLQRRRRALSASQGQPNVGAWLWMQAAGAAGPTGTRAGAIEAGQRADFIVLDPDHPQLVARSGDALIDSLVFVNVGGSPIREVWIGGRRVVAEGRHPVEAEARRAYAKVIARLRDAA